VKREKELGKSKKSLKNSGPTIGALALRGGK
jgi:hypothetical protein